MNIIAISGAACTGKTTLIEYMKCRVSDKRIQYYSEFIRTVFSEKYSSKYKDFADLLSGDTKDIISIHMDTAKLFNTILKESSDSDDILVFDRSPIDILIYLYMNAADRLLDDLHLLDEYKYAANYIMYCISSFLELSPTLFYTRPFSEEVEEDGFRPKSLIHKRYLEIALFDKIFLDVPTVTVMPSILEERVSLINTILNNINYNERV